jgi:hypothetical protein
MKRSEPVSGIACEPVCVFAETTGSHFLLYYVRVDVTISYDLPHTLLDPALMSRACDIAKKYPPDIAMLLKT